MRSSLVKVVAVTFFIILSLSTNSCKTSKPSFAKGPYLVYSGSGTSMKIIWQTDILPKSSKLYLGYTSDYELGTKEIEPLEDKRIFIGQADELDPLKKVYYKVEIDRNQFTSHFFTPPSQDAQSTVFYSFGDSRSFPNNQNLVTGAILKDIANEGVQSTFIVHTGDLVSTGAGEGPWQHELFNRDHENTSDLLAKVPLMLAIGNHDVSPIISIGENAYSLSLVTKYFPYDIVEKDDSFYYSFDWGPVHIAVIDQYMASYVEGSQQYNWLRSDLENSTKTWKIVALHAPAWSAYRAESSTGGHGNSAEAQSLHSMLLANGVDAVLQGHNHYYARCTVDGIEYLTIGGGGAPLYTPDETYENVVEARELFHFAKFEVDSESITVTIKDTEASTVSEFSITP